MRIISALILLSLLVCLTGGNGPLSSAQAQGGTQPQRSKVIDFEDEVVEGMNKRPLDSLSQVSERERRRKKQHLYRKRASFKTETQETIRLLRFEQ